VSKCLSYLFAYVKRLILSLTFYSSCSRMMCSECRVTANSL